LSRGTHLLCGIAVEVSRAIKSCGCAQARIAPGSMTNARVLSGAEARLIDRTLSDLLTT